MAITLAPSRPAVWLPRVEGIRRWRHEQAPSTSFGYARTDIANARGRFPVDADA
jgi:hypothetical protein